VSTQPDTKRKRQEDKLREELLPIPCTEQEMHAILDKWTANGLIRPAERPPMEEQKKHERYCRLHQYVQHPTIECRTLRKMFQTKIKDETLELAKPQQEVQRNPLPQRTNGRGATAVVIHGNVADLDMDKEETSPLESTIMALQKSPKFRSLFGQLGLGAEARKMATRVLVSIVAESGAQCFTAEAHASRAYLETTNAISFMDEDMEVQYPDHKRPLYLTASINEVQVRRALVDTGLSLNLILVNTLQDANILRRKIQGTSMEVTGFGGAAEYTIGHIQLALKVGPILSLTRFHVIDFSVSYHVLLGHPWLHKHKLVSSTYHQCVKGRLNGKPIRLPANNTLF
jgi:hypothetical protein